MELSDGIRDVYLKARMEGECIESARARAIAYYLHEAPWSELEEAAKEVNKMVLTVRQYAPSWGWLRTALLSAVSHFRNDPHA